MYFIKKKSIDYINSLLLFKKLIVTNVINFFKVTDHLKI